MSLISVWKRAALASAVALMGCINSAGAATITTDGDFGAQTIGVAIGSPWGPVSGNGNPASAAAQSPFTNLFADNGIGMSVTPNGGQIYICNVFADLPINGPGAYTLNVDFQITGAGSGYFALDVTTANASTNRSTAFYINDTNVYVDTSTGPVQVFTGLAQGTWYNAQLLIDTAAKTLSGSVTPFAGAATNFSGYSFVQTGLTIGGIFNDQGSASTAGLSIDGVPTYNIDNFALSTTTVPEPATLVMLGLGLIPLVRIGRRSLAVKYMN